MTPEGHYAEAERLLALAATFPAAHDETNPAATLAIAEAQVHATLATYTPPTTQYAVKGDASFFADKPATGDWSDIHGDTWREVGDGRLQLVAQATGACYSLGINGSRKNIEQRWGPLIPAAATTAPLAMSAERLAEILDRLYTMRLTQTGDYFAQLPEFVRITRWGGGKDEDWPVEVELTGGIRISCDGATHRWSVMS